MSLCLHIDLATRLLACDVLDCLEETQRDPLVRREGICGSCAMNINGTNGLACLTKVEREPTQASRYYPMPHKHMHLVAGVRG